MVEGMIVADCISRKDLFHGVRFTEFTYNYLFDGSRQTNDSFNIITKDRELHLVWKFQHTDTIHNSLWCHVWKIVLEKSDENVFLNLKVNLIYDTDRFKTLLDTKIDKITLPLEVYTKRAYCEKGSRLKINFEVYRIDQTECEVLHDLIQLLESGNLSDVTFIVENEEIRAHKLVLSTRNSVFSSMFECDKAEKKNGRVTIIDIEPEVFKLLLRFIYSGRISDVDTDNLLKLMVAGDKYSIKSLVSLCERRIADNYLDVNNVIDILVTADLVKADVLKKECMEFIFNNKDEVVSLPAYENFVSSNANLLSDLFRLIPYNKKECIF